MLEEDVLSRDYAKGCYHNHQFNGKDFYLRRELGLYCEQFFPEEEAPFVLRNLVKEGFEKKGLGARVLIIPASEVLADSSKSSSSVIALYLPITRIMSIKESERYFEQISPKCTEGTFNQRQRDIESEEAFEARL